MQELHSLLHSLTCAEWSSFKNYLTCFTDHNPAEVKLFHLAEALIREKEAPSHDACCIKFYGRKDDHCFDELKSDLKGKALDFLLTDISCDKKKELDAMDTAIIRMKKKSAQFQQLYYSKRRSQILYCLLNEILRDSKEFEQYPLYMEHLKFKKFLVGFKQGKEEFEKINKEMEHAQKCSALYNKAEHYYYELNMMNEYIGRQDEKKKLEWLRKVISEIETENKEIKSPHVNYSLKFLEIEYYQLNRNYLKARSTCLQWLDIVRDNKSVYRRQRVGVVYDNLSRCEFYLGVAPSLKGEEQQCGTNKKSLVLNSPSGVGGKHFLQAREWAQEAQKHFNLNSENYCISLEQEFYAVFAMGEYYAAIEIANKMISSATRKELGEFRHAKYNYLLANALFKEHKFEGALHLLSQEREISKDKAGWETGARTLKIMTLIEMLKLDEASLAVNSLKQFFTYTEKNGTPIGARDKKILNLLLVAERKGFMFTILNGNTDKYFSALTSGEESLRWEPFTHEVIPFHEWFAGKMGRKKVKAPSLKGEMQKEMKMVQAPFRAGGKSSIL